MQEPGCDIFFKVNGRHHHYYRDRYSITCYLLVWCIPCFLQHQKKFTNNLLLSIYSCGQNVIVIVKSSF